MWAGYDATNGVLLQSVSPAHAARPAHPTFGKDTTEFRAMNEARSASGSSENGTPDLFW